MKRLFSALLLFTILAGAASAAPINARIETLDKVIHIGTILERPEGAVVFQENGAAQAVRYLDEQISYIRVPFPDGEEDRIQTWFDEGEYRLAADKLNELLPPFVDYVGLPSNLSHKFMRWMVGSYWIGNYDRVLELAGQLQGFGNENFKRHIRFYGRLAEMELGDFQGMEAFLATPAAEQVYPKDSAARLYIEARLLQNKEEYTLAIRKASLLMALHSRDADWMPKAELLCATFYFKLGMPDSAQAVLDDMDAFYSDPEIKKMAAAIAAQHNGDER